MSKYTTELRFICENYAHLDSSVGYNDIKNVLNASWEKVFDFDFPIFDNDYKPILCKKILKHFYTREICEETVGLWKLRLDSRMNEIMPYFNKLYDSELISIDPLVNNRYTLTGNKKKTGSDRVQGSDILVETTGLTGSVIRTGGYTDTESGTKSNTKTGNIVDSNVKTGNITDVNTRTGKEELEKDGKEIETKRGEITKTKQGKVSDTKTGQGVTTEHYEGKGGKVTDTNIDLFTDTPQGDIRHMGEGYTGASLVPIVGRDTAYLTTAEKTTNEKEDLSEWVKSNGFGKDDDDNDFKEVVTRQYGEEGGQGEDYIPYTEKEDYGNDGVEITKDFENRKDTKTYINVKDDKTTTYNSVTDARTTTYNSVLDSGASSGTNARVYNSQTDTESKTGNKRDEGTNNKTTTYGGIDDYTESVLGSKGISDSKLLKEFRETFLNIDEMIINRLNDLFILLW